MDDLEPCVLVGRIVCIKAVIDEAGNIDMFFRLSPSAGAEIDVSLEGVQGLMIQNPMTGWPITLQITDRARQGWEGARYEFVDAEEGTFRCWCRTFTIS